MSAAPLALLVAALQAGVDCFPCDRAMARLTVGDTARALGELAGALNSPGDYGGDMAFLVGTLASVGREDRAVLVQAERAVSDALLERPANRTYQEAYAALAAKVWGLPAHQFPALTARLSRLEAGDLYRKRELAPEILAELQAVDAWRLQSVVSDRSFGVTTRRPPAVYRPCNAYEQDRALGDLSWHDPTGRPDTRWAIVQYPEEARLWSSFLLQIADPVFLTAVNERRLEHFARVVLARLYFGDPVLATTGPHTDRGRILIRYGDPEIVWEVGRPKGLPAMEDHLGLMIPASDGETRAILWRDGSRRPDFLFLREFGQRETTHSPKSRDAQATLRSIEPSTFDFGVGAVPHQVVRFKGERAPVDVDFYAEIPGDTIDEISEDVRAGLFVLPQALGQELASLRTVAARGYEAQNVTFRAPLEPGEYAYTVEMLSRDWAVARAQRGTIEVVRHPDEELSLSDLLVAHMLEATTDRPAGRSDFEIDPAVDLEFSVASPLFLYFEVYGLQGSAPGLWEYRVTVQIKDADRGSFLSRAIRGFGRLLGSAEGSGQVSWLRAAAGMEDRIPEWLRLDVDWEGPGRYEVVVTVEDMATEAKVAASRLVEVVP